MLKLQVCENNLSFSCNWSFYPDSVFYSLQITRLVTSGWSQSIWWKAQPYSWFSSCSPQFLWVASVQWSSALVSSREYDCPVCSLIFCRGHWAFPTFTSMERSAPGAGFHGRGLCYLPRPVAPFFLRLPTSSLSLPLFPSPSFISLFLSLIPCPHPHTYHLLNAQRQSYKTC